MSYSDLPVEEILSGYASGMLTPVDVIESSLARIDELNPILNAFRVVDSKGALEAAEQSADRWQKGKPLSSFDGLPASIKDQWLLKGFSTLKGSLTTDPHEISPEDSPAAARLREGGAVFVGKTNLCEFSWNGVTRSPLTGESRNPWNPNLTCGGSSGGAAIAAATRMSILNIASDGAGSIRIPSAFCGVFGFKPTYGRVPAYPQGLLPNCSHTGPITRTTSEAALMLDSITRFDPREWLAVGDSNPGYSRLLNDGVAGLRIGFSRTLGNGSADEEVTGVVEKAVAMFRHLGAIVIDATPRLDDPRSSFEVIYQTSLAAGVRSCTEQQRALLDPGLLRNAEQGRQFSVEDVMMALAHRETLGRQMNLYHEDYDLLITPQLSITAFACGHDVPPQSGMTEWLDWSPFTYLFNLTQQPAASVPCGFDSSGLPVAMQIVGARNTDLRVLQAARAFESIQPFPHCPVSSSRQGGMTPTMP